MTLDNTAVGAIESSEALREALLELRRAHDTLLDNSAHAQQLLDALESLLGLGPDDDPFERVFAALRKVFTFAQAMMLAEPEQPATGDDGRGAGALECIVADPPALVGSIWPVGPLFRKVMGGRVVTTFSNAGITEWENARAAGLSCEQSALYVPVRVQTRRGILVLLRSVGETGFDRAHVALAMRFSVLASHALATRFASQTAAEGRRLRELTEQLRQSEQLSRRNASLLQEVVNVLPIGVAVQDEKGRLLLVNHAIATALGKPVDELIGQIPFDLRSNGADSYERRRQHFEKHMASGTQHSRERSVVIGSRQHTLLVTGKPVTINDESLMLSASLDITERKRFEEELAHRAFHDQLTGLPNRALMRELVEATLQERDGQFALAFIDLDNFKQVNDYYSHAIGDALLKNVAARINQSIRSGDTLARISGDEFLLLIKPLTSEEALPPLIERVVNALKQSFHIEGHEVMTSASIGAAIYPLHGDSYESLRRSADSAMYRAKRHSKGSVSYFHPSMGDALTARMDLEQRLRLAIREQRFRAAFQPKVQMATGAVVGLEALVRWEDHDGTIRMPGEFIELASELGLLDDITRFVLIDVARHLPELSRFYGDHISVSVNIAARQAGDVAFMQALGDQLAENGLASRIVLELTEDALVATQRFQHQVLPRLRALGMRVSIDDFGTGFSSLSTLADITADEVKVDRAFITAIHERPRSQGILKAIESLCSALGIDVVAEGVETTEERDYLQQQTGIQMAQGYLFARPAFVDVLCAGGVAVSDQAAPH